MASIRTKYGSVKANGCDSKAEARRKTELGLLARAGKITDLEFQREFVLISKSEWGGAIKYRSDACYRVDGQLVVEDTKSPITAKNPLYRLKKRLMAEVYGIEIREVA